MDHKVVYDRGAARGNDARKRKLVDGVDSADAIEDAVCHRCVANPGILRRIHAENRAKLGVGIDDLSGRDLGDPDAHRRVSKIQRRFTVRSSPLPASKGEYSTEWNTPLQLAAGQVS